MKSMIQPVGVALFGFITSVLTAIAVVAISNATGINLFTFSLWLVVPIGAIGTGFVAASGYYFGALYFHTRATPTMLLQMVIIAGLTNILIYYLGYSTLVLDDGQRVADFASFSQYLDLRLTTAQYRLRSTSTGEVGSFGYVLALLQFIGFLFGGYVIYNDLRDKTLCGQCEAYLRTLSKKVVKFEFAEEAANFWDTFFDFPLDSSEFSEKVRTERKVEEGKATVSVETHLRNCPKCKEQEILQSASSFNGKEWEVLPDFVRRIAIPEGVSLSKVFRG
jgi:hypothetical protein